MVKSTRNANFELCQTNFDLELVSGPLIGAAAPQGAGTDATRVQHYLKSFVMCPVRLINNKLESKSHNTARLRKEYPLFQCIKTIEAMNYSNEKVSLSLVPNTLPNLHNHASIPWAEGILFICNFELTFVCIITNEF